MKRTAGRPKGSKKKYPLETEKISVSIPKGMKNHLEAKATEYGLTLSHLLVQGAIFMQEKDMKKIIRR